MSHPLFDANGNWIGAPLDFMRTKSLGQSQQKEQCPGCGQELDEEGVCPCEKNKDMSAMDATRGGALVAPPAMGQKVDLLRGVFRDRMKRKSLEPPQVKRMRAGFTGRYIDTIGREVCFRDGRRVSCDSGHFDDVERPGDHTEGGTATEEYSEGRGERQRSFTSYVLRARRHMATAVALVSGIAILAKRTSIAGQHLQKVGSAIAAYASSKNPDQQKLEQMEANFQQLQKEYEWMTEANQKAATEILSLEGEARDVAVQKLHTISNDQVPYVWGALKTDKVPNFEPESGPELAKAMREVWRHRDWMDAKPQKGETPTDFVRRNLPTLNALPHLDVSNVNNPQVRQKLYELSTLPDDFLKKVGGHGGKEITKIFVGKGSVEGLDDNKTHLNQIVPDTWPGGDNWDQVAVLYDSTNNQLSIGTEGVDVSASSVIHVAAHAYAHNQGLYNKFGLGAAHTRLKRADKLDPYALRSKKDLFAESAAVLMMQGEKRAIEKYDEDYVKWLKKALGVKK